MKTMWTSEGEVQQVEVKDGMAHIAGVGAWQSAPGTLHETETKARRAKVERTATAFEEEADRHDGQRADAETLAKGHMDDAEWNRVKAAEMRAKAKELRDALAELDAVEGRR